MNNNINKIDDSELENVSGGVIFNSTGISGADPSKPWEVLDDKNGNNIYENGQKLCFASRQEALDAAARYGMNRMEVNWNQVLQMRGQA